MWYSGCMPQGTFELERSSEAHCTNVVEPEIFFPADMRAVKARKWDPYCTGCPIKDLCGKAVYDGFTGVAGGEFYGTLFKTPEPKQRKTHSAPKPTAPMFHTALGSVIRQLRTEQGMTLRGLASKAFISASHLSDIELGKKEVSSGHIISAAKALGTPVSDIVRQAAFELELIELLDTSKDPARA